jgi:hypothetical protein
VKSDAVRVAVERMEVAFSALSDVRTELIALANVRASRQWSSEEYDRYLKLVQIEGRAARRCLAARRAFDASRRRTWRSQVERRRRSAERGPA